RTEENDPPGRPRAPGIGIRARPCGGPLRVLAAADAQVLCRMRALRGLQTPAASPIFSGTIPSANRRCPMSIRPVIDARPAQPTMEGAGVRLHRAFGFRDPKELDPFLLFDDFRNERPEDYLRGFPWHPHRGIETITYVLAGTVE